MEQVTQPGMNKIQSTEEDIYISSNLINIIKSFNISMQSIILDAGCGNGHIMKKIYDEGFENIYGFDSYGESIALAKSRFAFMSDKFALHEADNNKLPSSFPSEYDLVLSIEVIEHLYSPWTYLKNISSWLKKGGKLIISTPYHGYLKNFTIALFNCSDKHFDPLFEGGHIKFFSKKKIYELLELLGFKVVYFYGAGRIPLLWKSMIVVAEKK